MIFSVSSQNSSQKFSFQFGPRDAPISITPNSNVRARKGMVFNVNVGFSPITNKGASDSKGKEIALFIGDTVVVGDKDTPAQILTTSKKKIKNIAIFLKDADSSDGEKENKNNLPDPEAFGRGKRTAVLDQKLRQGGNSREQILA